MINTSTATIPVFSGLGTNSLFSSTTLTQALLDSQSSAAAQFLYTSCHAIFLSEVFSRPSSLATAATTTAVTTAFITPDSLPYLSHLDPADFQQPLDIINPRREKDRQSPVVQHAAICLVQLLRYLSYSRSRSRSLNQNLNREDDGLPCYYRGDADEHGHWEPANSYMDADEVATEVENSDRRSSSSSSKRKKPMAIAAVAGVCAGVLAAVAVATTTAGTVDHNGESYELDFLLRSRECFRTAVLLGIAADRARRDIMGNAGSLIGCGKVGVGAQGDGDGSSVNIDGGECFGNRPWSLIVYGVEEGKERIDGLISEFVAEKKKNLLATSLYVSSVNSKACFTVSGEGEILQEFADAKLLPAKYRVKSTDLFTLYHNSHYLKRYRDLILQGFERRCLPFPMWKDLRVPLVSTVDGSLIESKDGHRLGLLQDVLDMCLLAPSNWTAAQEVIGSLAVKISEEYKAPLTVYNYGPGHGAFRGSKDTICSIEVQDASVESHELPLDNDIAVVGMAVDLPDAPDLETLWLNLMGGLSSCIDIPADRFHIEDYYSRDGKTPINDKRSMKTKFGNFLKDPFLFDNQLFGISPREALSMDPQQRVMLQTVYRALENAGYVADSTPSWSRETFGCFIGNATLDYVENLKNNIDAYYSPGTLRSFLSGRISFVFDWSGPSMTIDTACASSLTAIHQASLALSAGDCRAAVVGGVNLVTSPDMYLGLDRAHFLSPTGQCKAFDERADGYCRGEGATAFVLKRYKDAINDNDRVLGVIRGTAVNQSGLSSSITHPHSLTQQKLFRSLLSKSRIRVEDVTVVEAHGTGTQAGDPNEINSIRKVFCQTRRQGNPLHVTSIKPNIGHGEAASGGSSLAKLLLMLKHKRVPPQALLHKFNPAIGDVSAEGILISMEPHDWTSHGKKRIALLNNFGASGSNAALLVQESDQSVPKQCSHHSTLTYVLGLSASTKRRLEELRSKFIKYLTDYPDDMSVADISYTSTARRKLDRYRLSTAVSSTEDAITALKGGTIVEQKPSPRATIFLFSGQGCQYLGMGKELMEMFPKVKTTLMRCHKLLTRWGLPSCLKVIQAREPGTSELSQSETIQAFQTGIFALEVGLADLLTSLGITPSVVTGHSLGEYAALVTAGVIDMESGLWLVARRARLIVDHCKLSETSMLAVSMNAENVRGKILSEHKFTSLSISCDNSPEACVIGGKEQILQELKEHISKHFKERCTMLNVPIAYHTAAVEPMLYEFGKTVSRIPLMPPKIPFASNVLGRVIEAGDTTLTSEYLVDHCRRGVAFNSGIADIIKKFPETEDGRWIEIGPHPALLSMVQPQLLKKQAEKLPTLKQNLHPSQTLSELFCAIYRDDIGDFDWRAAFDNNLTEPKLIDVPTTPMFPERYYLPAARESSETWISSVQSKSDDSIFSVLGSKMECDQDAIATFETPISKLSALIEGHLVCGKALCPASVYMEMALAAILQTEDEKAQTKMFKISKSVFHRPLILSKSLQQTVRVRIERERTAGHGQIFEISSFDCKNGRSDTMIHCSGILKPREQAKVAEKLRSTFGSLVRRKAAFQDSSHQKFSANTIYKIFSRVVTYSSAYQAVQQVFLDESAEEIFAYCKLPAQDSKARFAGQPILLDTMLHVSGFAANLNADNDSVYICHQVQSANIVRNNGEKVGAFEVHCSNFKISTDSEGMLADAYAVDEQGIIAVIKSMEFRKFAIRKIAASFDFATQYRAIKDSSTETAIPHSLHHEVIPQLSHEHLVAEHQPIEVPHKIDDKTGADSNTSSQSTLFDVISETTGVGSMSLNSQTGLASIGIDSLMTYELQTKLDEYMNEKPSITELSNCTTVGDIENLVSSSVTPLQSPVPRPVLPSPNTEPIRDGDKDFSGKFISRTGTTVQPLDEQIAVTESIHLTEKEMLLFSSRITPSQQFEQIQKPAKSLDRTPLYLIHPGAGFSHFYRHLGSLDRAVYALDDPRLLHDLEQDWQSVIEMAEAYTYIIKESKPRQSTRRVLLGGWSFGGIVAFEMARLLSACSDWNIQGVVLIDAPPPYNHIPISQKTSEVAMNAMLERSKQSLRGDAAEFAGAMTRLTVRNNMRRARLLGEYRPEKPGISAEVILLRSSEGLRIDGEKDLPENKWLHDRSDVRTSVAAWEQLQGTEIRSIDIPGDHFTPFAPENIDGTTRAVREACEFLEH